MALITIDDDLLLRTYTEDDTAGLYDAIDSSRRHLAPWLNWVGKTTRPEHSLQFIQRSQDQMRNQEALALGIFYQGRIIGGIGMHEWDQTTRRAQIGYWITGAQQGKGLVARSLPPFVSYLFEKTGLNKIEIHYAAANSRSAAVAARLGFVTEGIIRQSTMRNGIPEDVVVTGLLKQEWKAATLHALNS